MKYTAIEESERVSPGEYLFHEPTQEVVLCGSVIYDNKIIKVLGSKGMLSDKFENYKKIRLTKQEKIATHQTQCKGCGG